ncbi:TPA: ATP-binding protein [Streptococcus suis]|uniref:histidine kinase n=2 Tax=Streptococcus suis TaxID=1307 RepID=A0A075SR08_STRSU|nr:histidine kinase [Streptococcus suis 6407]HEL1573037.1 ATP-binding protein [Streptococcus suis]HEM3240903.1 ATP-binding protein [Streptococcus suis 11538]HEL1718695.1 ATP-binding protein [Streptococcus suis]HEL1805611.1 ATP-binding protein [Streptococcus suis]
MRRNLLSTAYYALFITGLIYLSAKCFLNNIENIFFLLALNVLLLLDFILHRAISTRSKISKFIIWLIRLCQCHSILFVIGDSAFPPWIQYMIGIIIYSSLISISLSLFFQKLQTSFYLFVMIVGLLSSVSLLFPRLTSIAFSLYLVVTFAMALLIVLLRNKQTFYRNDSNRFYWLMLLIFYLMICFSSIGFIFFNSSALFSGFWLFYFLALITGLILILFYHNDAVFKQKEQLLTLIFLILLYIVLFILILKRTSLVVLETVTIILYFQYFFQLVGESYRLITGSRQSEHVGINSILKEEALKQEFANFLHDNILQDINALIQLSRLDNPSVSVKIIEERLEYLNTFVRERMNQYSPQLLKGLSLYDNYRMMLKAFEKRYPKMNISLNFYSAKNIAIYPPYDFLIYRWLRELVNNAYKYSNAQTVTVKLARDGRELSLSVMDNGYYQKLKPFKHGHGLLVLEEQVKSVGGTITFEQADSNGLRVDIKLMMEGEKAIENFINR